MSLFNKNTLYIIAAIAMLLAIFYGPKRSSDINNGGTTSSEINVLNVYTSRKEPLIREVFTAFEQKYNTRVNFISDDANKLIFRAISEGAKSPMDVFIAADVNNLILAESKGLFAKLNSSFINSIVPEAMRSEYWTALTKRARVIIYDKSSIDPDCITSYNDLARPQYKGSLLISSSNSPYNQSLLAFIIAKEGEQEARNWVRGLVSNLVRKPQGGDTDQIRALIAGEGKLAIVNSYYLARQLAENEKTLDKVGVIFPKEGTMINISGAGIGKYSKNITAAQNFLEFMLTPEIQNIYSFKNQEYPINSKVSISTILQKISKTPLIETDIKELWPYLNLAVKIADEEGWR